MVIARLEKPHCGNSGVPFMNSTTSLLFTISSMRLLHRSSFVSCGRCSLKLQRMQFSAHPAAERGIDALVLPDPRHPREGRAHDPGGIMIAVAAQGP